MIDSCEGDERCSRLLLAVAIHGLGVVTSLTARSFNTAIAENSRNKTVVALGPKGFSS